MTNANTTHNGWTNYATWRVNLEWFDAMTVHDFSIDEATDVHDFSMMLKDYVEEQMGGHDFATDYALAFLANVNWYEIAQHMIDDSIRN